MKGPILLLFFSLSSSWLFAQDIISGDVKDDSGSPLPGATVLIKGTAAYTTSDIDGKFNIAAGKQLPFTLQISSVGFKTQEVEIYELAEEPLEVLLQNDNLLDEVVVVGYGVQKKSELTGAISSVSESVLQQPVSSVDRALQGAVPGVQVTPTSGQPGGGSASVSVVEAPFKAVTNHFML